FKQLYQFKQLKGDAYHWQAKALIEKKAWLDVKALVDQAEEDGNTDAMLYSMAADALMRLDDIPSAIYYLNAAVKLEPSSATWHLALAGANFELGATETATQELLQAGQLAGRDVEAWLDVARTYQKYKLFTDAITSYGRALNIEPTQPEGLSELATLQLAQNNMDEARALATKMASIKALKGTSYYILGRVALAEKKAPQALTFLAKAGQTDPDNANIWLAMANAYAALDKTKREKEYLLKAVALDDHNFDVHLRLGRTCVDQKDTACAKQHFDRAIALDEKNADARLGLAETLMKSGKLVEASGHVRIAIKYDAESVIPLLMLADIQSSRGMIPDSIATLKKAMLLDDANMQVHLGMAKAYISNHMYDDATAVAEKAMLLDVRNAEPLILMGNIYIARQLFDDAITIFGKAVELMPEHAKYRQYLNMAYLQKKRMVDDGGKMLGPKLKQLHFSRVFSAAYKQYTDVPVGKLVVKNEAGVDYTNIKISLFVKEYMDFPTTTVVDKVPANGEIEVNLLAAFNNKILDIDEDTSIQTEVKAEYYLAGKPHQEILNESMTVYGKNAIVWDKLDMVGSFVTPKDEPLAVFTRQLVNAYNPGKGAINARVSKAMTVYNGLSAYGIKYLVDPNTPYGNLDALQLDTVQFPRETLRQRSGDCDDLSILLAASLANLGIETAILDVPAHLLMMFNTGVPESRKDSISLNDEAIAIVDGQVWIPLEATLIAASFTEAWAEGARKYHLYGKQATMKVMPLAKAWNSYTPVTLPPADFSLPIPDKGMVGNKIKKEWSILSVKALERQVRPYRVMLALDPNDVQAQMQIAVVYARNGLFDEASVELERIHTLDPDNIAALNNLGNIHYLRQNYRKALAMYQQAMVLEPDNADVVVNIAMSYYKMGDSRQAHENFNQATEIDDQVPVRYEQLALLLNQ
ncbi:MAG: tetratricopeptide repeat protein, partial [Ghiorsea sp.]